MKEFKSKQVLKLEKIGLCGIPSLWMTWEELIKDGHINYTIIEEEERISKIQKIFKIHKKWENEKYFGSKRIGTNISTIQNLPLLSEYVTFSTDILNSKQSKSKDEKIPITDLNNTTD